MSKTPDISADDLYREDLINGIVSDTPHRENPAKELPLIELIKGLFTESPITREYFSIVCIRTIPIYMAVMFVVLLILFRESILPVMYQSALIILGVLWAGSVLAVIAVEAIIWIHLPNERAVECRKEYEMLINFAKEAIK